MLCACGSSTADEAPGGSPDEVDEVGGFDATEGDDTGGADADGDDAADAGDEDAARPVTPDDLCRTDDDCPDGERCRFPEPEAPVGLCTTACARDSDCPPGWGCFEFLGRSGETVRACVSERLCLDEDDDGYGWGDDCRGLDCDDTRDDVRPDADEVCNGRDDDCDGVADGVTVDDGAPCVTGYGGRCDPGVSACVGGVVTCAASAATDEVCNGVDDDCDGVIDDALTCGDEPCCFADSCDGVCATSRTDESGACAEPIGYGDEVCDDLDNDCDGAIDEGFVRRALYPDADGDGFGDETAEPYVTCLEPDGFVTDNTDCDDGRRAVFPGNGEVYGDEIDGNCDGVENCFADVDGDRVVVSTFTGVFVESEDLDCDDPGEAPNPSSSPDYTCCDCDDDNPDVGAGVPEVCDGVDNDCNGLIDEATRSWCCCVDGRCYEPGDVEPMFEDCRGGERVCLPGAGAVEVASCD